MAMILGASLSCVVCEYVCVCAFCECGLFNEWVGHKFQKAKKSGFSFINFC